MTFYFQAISRFRDHETMAEFGDLLEVLEAEKLVNLTNYAEEEKSEKETARIRIQVQNKPKEVIKDIISKKYYICPECDFKVPRTLKAEFLVLHLENSHPEENDEDLVTLTPELIKSKFQVLLGSAKK